MTSSLNALLMLITLHLRHVLPDSTWTHFATIT